jgi:hypothetical protein
LLSAKLSIKLKSYGINLIKTSLEAAQPLILQKCSKGEEKTLKKWKKHLLLHREPEITAQWAVFKTERVFN